MKRYDVTFRFYRPPEVTYSVSAASLDEAIERAKRLLSLDQIDDTHLSISAKEVSHD